MKRKLVTAALAATLLTGITGCGQKYSPGCKKSSELTGPWTAMGLPVDDGRVCESDDKRARFEFIGGSKQERATAFEQALTRSGFSKESCPSYCVYTKDTQRVQVIVGDVSNKWVTVSAIMSVGKARSSANEGGPAPTPTTTAVAAAPASGVDGIAECSSYFTKLQACPPAKGPLSRAEEANIKKRELQTKLDKGSRVDIIKRTCETFEKTLKC